MTPPLETPGPRPRLSLEELREMDALAGERHVEATGITHCITRGGVRLRFPGDEERAARLSPAGLLGEAPPAVDVPDHMLQPRTLEDLERAGAVLAKRVRDGVTTVVTRGGRRLRFPGDEMRAARLTDSELDGRPRHR